MRSWSPRARLQSVKGIGEALAAKISELHATGRLEFLDKLKASIEPGLVEMLEIPGLGPKKIAALRRELGVTSIADLEKACKEGRVAALAGFGEKTQEKILAGIRNREAYSPPAPLVERERGGRARSSRALRALPQVERAETAGSLRRGLETVGDLDFIVSARDDGAGRQLVRGAGRRRGGDGEGRDRRRASGLRGRTPGRPSDRPAGAVRLRPAPFHRARRTTTSRCASAPSSAGLSLSEWGLVPSEGEGTATRQGRRAARASGAADEKAIFAALGLAFIPPELREGAGEIEAAEKGEIPRLVELSDIRGAFHNHTTESDGRNTLAGDGGRGPGAWLGIPRDRRTIPSRAGRPTA